MDELPIEVVVVVRVCKNFWRQLRVWWTRRFEPADTLHSFRGRLGLQSRLSDAVRSLRRFQRERKQEHHGTPGEQPSHPGSRVKERLSGHSKPTNSAPPLTRWIEPITQMPVTRNGFQPVTSE